MLARSPRFTGAPARSLGRGGTVGRPAARCALWLLALLAGGSGSRAALPSTADIAPAARVLLLGPGDSGAPRDVSRLAGTDAEPVALHAGQALVVQWAEPRLVQEMEVEFDSPRPRPEQLTLSWWQCAWPESPDRFDDLSHGRWIPSPVRVETGEGEGAVTLRFPALTEAELFPAPAGRIEHRRTRQLGLRCACDGLIRRIRVRSTAPLRTASLLVEWNLERPAATTDPPSFDVWNGTIRRVAEAGRTAAVLDLEYGHTEDPLSPEAGRLLVDAGPRRKFAVNLDDVLAGDGLWLRDPGFFLVDSGSGRRYAAWRTGAGGRAASMPVLEDVATTGEDAFAATLDEAVINRPGPMVLGLPGERQDFILFPDGSLELRTAALRTPGLDTLARPWPWPAVRWRFLTGARPRLPQGGERSLLDGWLPVVCRTWREDGLAWQQRSLVCSLHASGTEATDSPTSQLTVLATEFSVTNHTAAPCTARLWIETEPAVPLRLTLDGALVLDRPSDGEPRAGLLPVRGRLHSDGRGSLELRVARETPEGTDAGGPMRGFVCHEVQLAPGEGHAIALFIPGVELLTPDETARLKELRFATCIEAVRPHWHALSHAGARIEVPSPVLNRLFQANHWRTLSAMNPEPATGAWHLKTPFGAAAIPLDKVADLATLLDRRGEHEAAERLLLPALTNQGRRGPRGAFVDVRGAFCAQHPELPDPFGADRPAAQHGRLLSALANHVRLAPEPAFRERYLGNLLLAADWILRARLPDGRAAPAGIAPGQDEVRAGATDATFLAGLQDLARVLESAAQEAFLENSERERLRQLGGNVREQAAEYRDRLRDALDRTIAITPVTRLRDGTWLPAVPWRWETPTPSMLDGRYALAASPLWLVAAGAIDARDPATGWMLNQIEDNLLLGRMTGRSGAFSVGKPSPATLAAPMGPVFIERDEPAPFWWTLRNLLANRLDRATAALLPEEVGLAGTPGSFASTLADECRLIDWLFDSLVRERTDGLDLCAAAPRAWFQDGRTVRIRGLRTAHGSLDLQLHSRVADGLIEGTVRLTGARVPDQVRLRIRHPQGRAFREVTVNGRRTRTDHEWVRLSLEDGVAGVIAKY